MSLFKCKMCGGSLEISAGTTVVTCEYCGTQQTLPRLDDEKRANMYDRANHFRRNNEFDKAMGIYENILNEDNTDAEAYWSIVLCRYGIEYVEDPATHKRLPTINRAQFTSIFDDDNYKSALQYADSYQKIIYEEEAKAINEIQKGILAISQKEEPFDVFICYKESDNSGRRTQDSVLAQELYYGLKDEGFKVFFSRITLEDKIGSAYEPYIFAALNSAKVMVVLGTKPEFFNAVWVKNEWSRYLSLIKQGHKKMLIPAYKDMNPYDLPEEFSHLQAQDMSKLGFMQDLIRGIKKIAKASEPKPTTVIKETAPMQTPMPVNANIVPLLKRAFLFLEDGDFDNADVYSEKILDIDPECSDAYIVKLLINLNLCSVSQLSTYATPIDRNPNYVKALRFAKGDARNTIEGYNQAIVDRIDLDSKKQQYAAACSLMSNRKYDEAVLAFSKIKTFKDSEQKIDDCKVLKETERCDGIYARAIALLDRGQFDESARLFKTIENHKDSKEQIKHCTERKEEARKDAIYTKALARVLGQNANDAAMKKSIEELHTISGFRDVDDKIRELDARLEKWYDDKRKAEEAARIKAEEERRTREREAELRRIKAEKNKRIAKKTAKIGIPSVVAFALFMVLLFNLIIPLIRYNKADKLFNEGKYEEAMAIYKDIDGRFKSEQRISVLKAIDKIVDVKFEAGIKQILDAGVPVKITYGTGGGDFSGSTHLSAPKNDVSLLSTSETPQETTEFVYNSSAEFMGLQTPGRNGYRFVQWELESYNYQVKGTFEIKLNAVWSEKEYIIEYNNNGGALEISNPVEYSPGDESFTLSNPTRTGYTFIGWTGTGLNEPTMSVTVEKGSYGDRSYEANWQANTYTITLNADGGSVENATVTVTYDQAFTLENPKWDGHTFSGWYEGNNKITDGTWNRISDIELIARWDVIDYAINYNLNGGTNESSNPDSYTFYDEIKLSAPTRTGYTFIGWTSADQTTPALDVTIPVGTIGNKEYTANWSAASFTLTFDATGGSISPETQTVTYDASYTLPAPTRTGYTFAGWFFGSKQYTDGIWKEANNVTLQAAWIANTYKVTYKNYDGSATTEVVVFGSSYTLPVVTRKGYAFLGWYNGETKFENGVWSIASDVTLTSKWEEGRNIITLDANGGTVSSKSISVIYNKSYSLPTPTRTGYTFAGWYYNGTKYSGGVWTGLYDITLTAKWNAISNTITLDANGGSVSTNSITVTYDKAYTLPTPTKNRHAFEGWYYNDTKYSSGVWTGLSDIALTARWRELDYSTGLAYEVNSDGTCTITGIGTCDDTDIVIPDNIDGHKVTRIGFEAFFCCNITSITIPNSVTSVGEKAFMWCSSLTSIEIPDSVTSVGEKAFMCCSSLTSITIPTGVTSVGENAFFECSSLTSITIPTGVTSIGACAFSWCSSLTSIEIPDSVTSVGENAFMYCSSLTSITIPTGVTSIGDCAFEGCSSLTSVVIPDSVTSIGGSAFYNCDSLTSITIPNSVTSIGGGAFNGCSSLTSITIPDSVTSIGDSAFNHCDNLTSIEIPNSVTSIGGRAFSWCRSLTSVDIPNSVTSIGYDAFYYCSSLTSVYFGGTRAQWNAIKKGYDWDSYTGNYTVYCVTSYRYTVNSDGTTCTITGAEDIGTELIIPSEIDGYKVTSIGEGAFYCCSSLTSIELPNSVTNIGRWAFGECYGLVSINIPDSVKSIDYEAFLACTSLTSITVDKNNQYYQSIDGNLYNKNGTILVLYAIGKKDTSFSIPNSVKMINVDAFRGCTNLTKIEIPNSVKSIYERAFYDCSSLTSIEIPDSVTSIGFEAFYYCSSLTSVYFGGTRAQWNAIEKGDDWDSYTGNYTVYCVTSYRYTVNSDGTTCTITGAEDIGTELIIPSEIDGYKVTSIGSYVFYYCSSLTSIEIPNSVTSIGSRAFYKCSSLTSIEIPDSVTSIGFEAFYYCSSLTSVTIGNSVTTIGDRAFNGCSSLTSVTIGNSVTSIGSYAFSGCSSLTSIEIPNSATSIGDRAFYYCSSLTSVTIGNSVTTIGDRAFNGCSSLTSIDIPDSVTSIGSYAFSGCSSLTSITVDKNNRVYHSSGNCIIETATKTLIVGCNNTTIPTDGSVTSIDDGAFFGCTSLTSITIPNSITSIGVNAFRNCTNLNGITIPNSVTSIGGGAFNSCTSLTSITIPNSVTSISEYVFQSCTNLTSITIPNSVTNIDNGAFSGCTSLASIIIPDSVTSIDDGAFSGCTSLTSITIPDGVTSIGDYAFSECSSLTSITIPNSVTSIGSNAFFWCSSLTSINYGGTKAQWNGISKGDYWDDWTGKYTVYCKD